MDSKQRIIVEATRLFALHGFNGVSTRQIAAAAGLNIATMHHHAGSKRELYHSVLERLHEQERAVLDQFTEHWRSRPAQLSEAVDWLLEALLALFQAEPDRARIYVGRWLAPADEWTPYETEQALAMFQRLRALIESAQVEGLVRRDLDVTLFLRSLDWLLLGYFVAGPIDPGVWRGDATAPESLAAFKSYLRNYVDGMLGLQAPAAQE